MTDLEKTSKKIAIPVSYRMLVSIHAKMKQRTICLFPSKNLLGHAVGLNNRVLAAVLLLALTPLPAHAIDQCKGGNRAARKVTCVVDGDTIWSRGVKMRLLDIDAPEMSGECQAEKVTARKATARLVEMMSAGYRIDDSGNKDRTSDRRSLVRIKLVDGRDAGSVLVREGLAQRWPNIGNIWCSASHSVQ